MDRDDIRAVAALEQRWAGIQEMYDRDEVGFGLLYARLENGMIYRMTVDELHCVSILACTAIAELWQRRMQSAEGEQA